MTPPHRSAARGGSQDLMARVRSNRPIEYLEDAVKGAAHILDKIRTHLNAAPAQKSVAHWIERITDLEAQLNPGPTIIGLLGSTGAGKSSLVNAVLGEEQYVKSPSHIFLTLVFIDCSFPST